MLQHQVTSELALPAQDILYSLTKIHYHYENTPIQIYKKNSPRKTEIFRIKKKTLIFFQISVKDIDCVGTHGEAVLTSTHNQCF